MAIYDGNMKIVDSLIIGDLVTVVIDSGESVDRDLRIKRCSVLGDNSSLKIINDFQVMLIYLYKVSKFFRLYQCSLVWLVWIIRLKLTDLTPIYPFR